MLGEGARAQRGGINKIRPRGGPFPSDHGINVKYHGLVRYVTHDFYVKINPRQNLGDAVACTSVAPM